MRRVRALVEVDGKEREMEFLTNNLQWSARSVADLYRGICLDSVGQQVDISVIWGLRRMPISQDSFSNSMGRHRDHTEEIHLLEPINS